jgi:hypothetical protein
MKQLLIAGALLVLTTTLASATNNNPADSLPSRKSSRYYLSVRSAILPCTSCRMDGKISGLLSTVHGFKLNRTFGVGVGAGLTSAGDVWLAPVFGNLRMNMDWKKEKKNKLFLEFNYGWGFSPTAEVAFPNGSQSTKCKRYFQPSIGYSIRYHDLRIGIMLGTQSVKMETRSEYQGYYYGYGIADWRPSAPNVTEFEYVASRLLLGISIGWRE